MRLGLDGLDVVGAVRGRLVLGLLYVFLCHVSKAGFTEAWLWLPSRTLRRLLLRGLIITRRDDSSTSVSILGSSNSLR